MIQLENADELSSLVVELLQKEQLIESSLDFVELGKENGINIDEHIFFHGEYQKLLFEGIVLNLAYLLIDKVDDENNPTKNQNSMNEIKEKLSHDLEAGVPVDDTVSYLSNIIADRNSNKKSRMQIALDEAEKKLKEDIDQQKPCYRFTVEQKEEALAELQKIRRCKDYRKAIDALKTARNSRVPHREIKKLRNGATYQMIKLVCKNVKRCWGIHQLVCKNIGLSNVSFGAAEYDHRNIVQALLIQKDVIQLKNEYHKSKWKIGDKWFSHEADFWQEILKILIEKECSSLTPQQVTVTSDELRAIKEPEDDYEENSKLIDAGKGYKIK